MNTPTNGMSYAYFDSLTDVQKTQYNALTESQREESHNFSAVEMENYLNNPSYPGSIHVSRVNMTPSEQAAFSKMTNEEKAVFESTRTRHGKFDYTIAPSHLTEAEKVQFNAFTPAEKLAYSKNPTDLLNSPKDIETIKYFAFLFQNEKSKYPVGLTGNEKARFVSLTEAEKITFFLGLSVAERTKWFSNPIDSRNVAWFLGLNDASRIQYNILPYDERVRYYGMPEFERTQVISNIGR